MPGIDPLARFRLDGKIALVTGGRRGLGLAIALGLAKAGARIAVIAKSPHPGDLLTCLGGDLLYIQADLSLAKERQGLVDRVASRLGGLDILVNNAGIQHRGSAECYPADQWSIDLELHLSAVLDLSQQALPVMRGRGGGKIIHMASISSFQGARSIIGYSTAKHGLVGLTKCMANEWAPLGINVNAIAPGLFRTDMAASTLSDQRKADELLGRIPSGRFGDPEDIVGPALFLASEASRHVHGHVLVVDGGWMGR